MQRYNAKIKAEIESVLRNALFDAIAERDRCKILFSEESLRYIVMKHLSVYGSFGRFPNLSKGQKILVFEHPYKRLKTKDATFKPDISSVLLSKNNASTIEIDEYLLAVELKIKNDVSDIKKCRNYISEKHGRTVFNLAICVVLPPKNSVGGLGKIKKSEITTRVKGNILFCSTKKNEKGDEVVFFLWLN
jgi:hypothetical protein